MWDCLYHRNQQVLSSRYICLFLTFKKELVVEALHWEWCLVIFRICYFFHPLLWSVPVVIYRHRACKIETVENWVTSLPRFMFRDASLAGVISHMGLFILQKSANTTKQTGKLVYLFIYNFKEELAVGTLPSGHPTMHNRHFTVCNGHSTYRCFWGLNTLQNAVCRGFGDTAGVSTPMSIQ